MFDGLTGDLLKSELRKGSCYTSADVSYFTKSYLELQGDKYPHILKIIRGDSGFAVPKLYELAEANDMLYCIRLKANQNLYKNSKHLVDELIERCNGNFDKYMCIFDEFNYKAKPWNIPRMVIVKIEKPPGKISFNHTFIVTNMEASPEDVVKFYCKRGAMENFIKEYKNGFNFNNMSNRKFITNSNKLQQLTLAYNLINWLRRLCFSDEVKSLRIEMIRNQFIKVAAKVTKSSRNIVLKFCSSFPNKHRFLSILDNVYDLRI